MQPNSLGEAERIAGELTKAQCWWVLNHAEPYEHSWGGYSCRHERSWANAGRCLLTARVIAWHPDPRETATRLTPLGLAVRTILQQREGGA